jgi:hypothetical protein
MMAMLTYRIIFQGNAHLPHHFPGQCSLTASFSRAMLTYRIIFHSNAHLPLHFPWQCSLTASFSMAMLTYRIIFSELNFDPLAQWWKHLGEDNLFIPDGTVGVLLYTGPTLHK